MKLTFKHKGKDYNAELNNQSGDSPSLLFQTTLVALVLMGVPFAEQVKYAEKLLAETRKLRDIYE